MSRIHCATYVTHHKDDNTEIRINIGEDGLEMSVSRYDDGKYASISHDLTWAKIEELIVLLHGGRRRNEPKLTDGQKAGG